MRWQGGRRGGGVEDRRGGGGVVAGGGIGVAVIALIGYFVFGIDPSTTTQLASQFGQGASQGEVGSPGDEAGGFVDVILTNTTDVWSQLIDGYTEPRTILYTGGTPTACGQGQAAMGPFYCPGDQQVYLDLSFWDTMEQQLGAGGDFAQAYVIAHEVGHHVQTLTGTSDRVRAGQQAAGGEAGANAWQVAMELQADCYAGVWAAHAGEVSNGEVALQQGDIEEGLNAASQIGDDTLSGGRAAPDSFTHGSSAQRVEWLRRGYQSGDPDQCDTYSALGLTGGGSRVAATRGGSSRAGGGNAM